MLDKSERGREAQPELRAKLMTFGGDKEDKGDTVDVRTEFGRGGEEAIKG